MSDTIVVFGGSGFIGTHLLKELTERLPNTRLVSVDISRPKNRLDGVTYIQADVRQLEDFDVEGEVSTIFNLAAVHTTPGHETHEYYETNVAGASQITAFARRKSVHSVVFTSSISVYGPEEHMKLETTPPTPKSAYGWSKWLAEGIHRTWLDEDAQRRLVICRPAVIFGPNEGGNFTRLARLLKKGVFIFPGRRDTIKACYYVGDLISSILYAAELKERFVLFNGCYADRYTLEQIVETFKEDHFQKVRIFDVPRWVVSSAARVLQPVSVLGLGIHPERITKLVKSTDVFPGWLEERGVARRNRLAAVLHEWRTETNGRFD